MNRLESVDAVRVPGWEGGAADQPDDFRVHTAHPREPVMPPTAEVKSCDASSSVFVCRCLRVTENQLVEAMTTREVRTLRVIRQETGAGGGCMVCHRLLRKYIEQYAYSSSSPICSDK
jgi:bacterioferritin-associated ferredoxin